MTHLFPSALLNTPAARIPQGLSPTGLAQVDENPTWSLRSPGPVNAFQQKNESPGKTQSLPRAVLFWASCTAFEQSDSPGATSRRCVPSRRYSGETQSQADQEWSGSKGVPPPQDHASHGRAELPPLAASLMSAESYKEKSPKTALKTMHYCLLF